MTLAPLLAAPLAIQLHAIAALSLIPLTLVQLGRRKSGAWHRRIDLHSCITRPRSIVVSDNLTVRREYKEKRIEVVGQQIDRK